MDCQKLQKITRIVNTPYLKSAELRKFFAALNEPFSKSHRNRNIEIFLTLQLSKRCVLILLVLQFKSVSCDIITKTTFTKVTVADTL